MRARIKRVTMSPEALFRVLETGTAWKVEQGIPKDAKLCGLTTDPDTDNLYFFVEHDSFDEITIEKDIAPQLKLLFKKLS